MNGRIYAPVLKGFMSPDNFVQDPQNSQNFNRYAYCYNNPLMYTDPSGEYGVWEGVAVAAIIGTIIAAANYTYQALTTWMEFTPMGLYKSATIGGATSAAMALVSAGVGSLASNMFPTACTATTTATNSQLAANSVMKPIFQAVMHGITQGAIAGVSGGSFWQGFAAGSVSSTVSSISMKVNYAANLSATAGDVSTMFFGSISGGLSAELSGGNFWQGAATGLVVSGLNHVAHEIEFNRFVKKWSYRVQEELDAAGYDPDGIPQATTSYGNTMISKLRTLQIMNKMAKGQIRVTEIVNKANIRGEASAGVGIRLSNAKGSWTFTSNTTYALVLIHEGAHIMIDVLGTTYKSADHEHYQIFRTWLLPMVNLSEHAYGIYEEFKSYAEKTGQSSKL